MSDFTIREATREDAPAIFEMIKALADYEKEPHSVESSVEDIQRDGFGEEPLFHCLLAEMDGKTVGFSLYFYKWSTWTGRGTLHLEDLFVLPETRGKGIGMALLKRLARITVDKGFKRFEWEVLDWNMLARDFYHSIGAFHREGWYPYRVVGEALEKLAE